MEGKRGRRKRRRTESPFAFGHNSGWGLEPVPWSPAHLAHPPPPPHWSLPFLSRGPLRFVLQFHFKNLLSSPEIQKRHLLCGLHGLDPSNKHPLMTQCNKECTLPSPPLPNTAASQLPNKTQNKAKPTPEQVCGFSATLQACICLET